jgi:lysophospholipase L1-like esterase
MKSEKNSEKTSSTWAVSRAASVPVKRLRSPRINFRGSATIVFTILIFQWCGAQTMALRTSDRIVLFGDSITEQGELRNGYVSILRDSLKNKFPGLAIIGAGISGNRVPQLQERLNRDVLSQRPTIVIIYIGINDVWHFEKHGAGTPKETYESGLHDLVLRINKAGVGVVVCTPSVIGERRRGENPFDAMLEEYSAISRSVARDLGAHLCDLRKAFIDHLALHNPDNKPEGILTVDSVHLNDAGNRLVADTILKALEE